MFSYEAKPFCEVNGSTTMIKRLVRPGIVIFVALIVMAIGNPSEEEFLKTVSSEYGAVHGGMGFSTAELLAMGESRRQSYFLFSTYEYEFGTIGVRYVGFLFSVFHIESYRKEATPEEDEEGVLV